MSRNNYDKSALPHSSRANTPPIHIEPRYVHQSYTPYHSLSGHRADCTFLHYASDEENVREPCWGTVDISLLDDRLPEFHSFPSSNGVELTFRCEGHYSEILQPSVMPISCHEPQYYELSPYAMDDVENLIQIDIESWYDLHCWMKNKIILL